MDIDRIVGYPDPHWNKGILNAYVYKDLLEESFFNLIQQNVKNILKISSTKTFYTHNTIFTIENKVKKIVSHSQNDREQNVIYDLTFHPEFYYQTNETVKDWSEQILINTVSPIFLKYLKVIKLVKPFCEDDNFIPYRLHINKLQYKKLLGLHIDSNNILTNCNMTDARYYSLTFYLQDHIEGLGGELYTLNGFVFKPVRNTAIMFNGNQIYHGVTQNMNKDTRLAFTTRWIHKDDLFLPGHPDKHLYKQDHL